jgi:predicted aspartyl protease
MFQYDATYEPPAPTAKVVFAQVGAGPDAARVEAQMLIDTGADISLIPHSVVDAIRAAPTGRTMEVMSFDGHKSARPVVAASMHLGKYKMNVEFLLHDDGETTGIIGRNVLNLFYVVLDGPTAVWNVSRASSQGR